MSDRRRSATTPLSEAALDEALAHWPMAPLPPGFAVATLRRVQRAPRFRLAAGDVVAALLAALVVVVASAAAGAGWLEADRVMGGDAGMAVARWWLGVRPVDPRVPWLAAAAVAMAAAALGVVAAVGRSPRAWVARAR